MQKKKNIYKAFLWLRKIGRHELVFFVTETLISAGEMLAYMEVVKRYLNQK